MDFSIATPKDFKGPDDDQADWIPHALIGILVEGVTYGLASVDARRKRLVPNDGNRRKRPQVRFSKVGMGLTIEEAAEKNDQADMWGVGLLVKVTLDQDVTENPLSPIKEFTSNDVGVHRRGIAVVTPEFWRCSRENIQQDYDSIGDTSA